MTACSNDLLTLGKQNTIPYQFDAPRLVALVASGPDNENPTLTEDLLELYFSSGEDVWMAQRAALLDPFPPPTLVAAANSSSRETSPAISHDGLSLWVGSDRPGGLGDLDIWTITRSDRNTGPWSQPRNVAVLNSPGRDIPRSPGQRDLVMPMASDRSNPGTYQTMTASRQTTATEFGAPKTISELAGFGGNADACLSDDGLFLFFASGNKADLFFAQRSSVTEPFAPAVPVADLNTEAAENDPWMSPDATAFYFTSDRADGTLQIYVSAVHPRSR